MKVYIVSNEYKADYESECSIIGVYDSIEKAQNKISKLYQDDCDWLQEWTPEDKEFEENIREENCAYIQYDCYWSRNWIEEFDVE